MDLLYSLPAIPQIIASRDEELVPIDGRVNFGNVTKETVDVLRRTPSLHPGLFLGKGTSARTLSGLGDKARPRSVPCRRQSVEFLGDRKVHVVEEPVEETIPSGHVLIETTCSVISTGTDSPVALIRIPHGADHIEPTVLISGV